jgi:hypothetical protein
MPETTVLPGEKLLLPEISPIPVVEEAPLPEEELPPIPEEPVLPEETPLQEEPISGTIRLEQSPPTDEEIEAKIDEIDAGLPGGKTPSDDDIEQKIDELDDSAGVTDIMGTEVPMGITQMKQTAYAGMADLLDLPYDAAATIINAALTGTGLDKITGKLQTDAIRRFADYHGISLPEDEIPDEVLADVMYFLGQGLISLPLSAPILLRAAPSAIKIAFSRFGGKNAKSVGGRFFGGEWPKALLPKGWDTKLPILEKVNLKESLKAAISTMRETAVRSPVFYGFSELLASAGAGGLYGIAKRNTDNPTVQLFAGLVGGVVPGVALTLIKTFMFGGLRIVWDSGRTLSKLDEYPRSSKRLSKLVDDPQKAIKNLEGGTADDTAGPLTTKPLKRDQESGYTDKRDADIPPDESILKEIEDAMSPIQKARSGSSINDPQVIRDLLPLEKAILDSDIKFARQGDKQRAALNDILIRAMSEPQQGDINLTKQELQKQRRFIEETITARFNIAQRNAEEAIKKLGPKIDRTAANRIAGKELDAALKDTRDQENILWGMVDDTATAKKSTGKMFESSESGSLSEVITSPLIDAWRKLLRAKGSTADSSDYKFSGAGSSDLYKQLGHFNDQGKWVKGTMRQLVTLKDLQVFRSRMLEEIRGEKAKLNSGNKRRIFGELQAAIMKMFEIEELTINMKMVDGVFTATQPERQLLKAISFSRMLNDRFNKGEVSKILGSNKDGSFKVDEELTLQSLLGIGKNAEERAVHFKSFIKAIERENTAARALTKGGEDTTLDELSIRPTLEAAKAYIKHMFFHQFVTDGVIAEKSAIKWVKDNRETLKQIPGLKQELETVMETGKTALLRESQNPKMKTLLRSPERSMTVYLAEHEPMALYSREGQFSGLSQKQFETQIDKLIFKVAKDTSGGATKGAQQSVFDWVLQKSVLIGTEKSKNISATQQNIFSGFQMSRVINDPKNAYIFKKILTPEQNDRLALILRSALEVDAIRNTGGLPEKAGKPQRIMDDMVGGLLSGLARVLGADVGRRVAKVMGGGVIQTPGMFAGRFDAIAKRITRDYAKELLIKAATSDNPELFLAIMKRIETPADEKYVRKHLNAYLATLMSRENIPFPKEDFYGSMEDEEDEPVDAKLRLMKTMEQPQ